jgi:hypothetical protein
MIKPADNRIASADDTARMIREEVILRPARRAAVFCAIVILGLTGTAFADSAPAAILPL